jgi:hypothetical protein
MSKNHSGLPLVSIVQNALKIVKTFIQKVNLGMVLIVST